DRGRLRRPHRSHRRQPRLGRPPDPEDPRRGPPRPPPPPPRPRPHLPPPAPRPMTDPRLRAAIRYPNDLTVPGMWHVRLVRSPHPAARVTAVDASPGPPGAVLLAPGQAGSM